MTSPTERIAESRRGFAPSNLLTFPLEEPLHRTVLQFVRFEKTNPTSRPYEFMTGQISLPIPENMQEIFGVSYQSTDLGFADVPVSAGADIARQLEAGGLSNLSAESVANMLEGSLTWASEALIMRIVDALDPGIRGSVVREIGKVKNRKTTSIFDGVALRQYTLDWKLSAKSAEESYRIQAILDEIKKRMHPSLVDGGISLSFPDEVYIYIIGSGQFSPIYRKAVITNLSVNHTATGTPSFFAGTGAPVRIDMVVSFQEVEIMTRDDWGVSATDEQSRRVVRSQPPGTSSAAYIDWGPVA